MRRQLAVILVGLLGLMMLIGAGIANSADDTVRTRGDENLVPNALIQSTLKFTPGNRIASAGDTVTWIHDDKTTAPHTVTIVDQADLPQTVEEVFTCAACGAALDAHFAGGPPPAGFVDADGDGGLNAPGDSLWLPPGGAVSAEITADGGTLYYLCAIHPWMQGAVQVRE